MVLGLGVLLYGMNGGGWGIFALALLAPDLSALGYLVGRRVGTVTYNVSHAYPVPAALAVVGLLSGSPVVLGAALVWFAHIGMDRMIGYGLKYPESVKDTHLAGSEDRDGEEGIVQINREAPVKARQEIFVAAAPERVWAVQADVDSWPEWSSVVSRAKIEGPLSVGSVFRWRSGGVNLVSTVGEVEPGRRLGWTGRGAGARAVHTWKLTPRDGGTLVETEESFEGWPVRLLRGMMQRNLEGSLRSWLRDLKRRAEDGA